jgi:hypothetical protein
MMRWYNFQVRLLKRIRCMNMEDKNLIARIMILILRGLLERDSWILYINKAVQ